MQNILEVKGLTKKFGEFTANDHIDLDIREGEIHAIIGENGAGKSTLMNMLYGILQPTSGEICFKGERVHLTSPKDSIALGIGMVHQHFKLSPSLTIYENVLLGEEIDKTVKIGNRQFKTGIIDHRTEKRRVQELVDFFNFNLNVDDKVQDISIGAKQRVEILKMLYRNVDILILDEPTAVLIPQEIDELIKKLHELRAMGKTIIIITHKLEEVKLCADRITVIRKGQVVGTVNNDDKVDTQRLAEMMVGRPVLLQVQKSERAPGEKVLFSVQHLSAVNADGRPVLKDVSFDIHEGEVLGVAGIDGNGQTELMFALTGLMRTTAGKILLEGCDITNEWPDEIRERGVGIIPEDRYKQGVCFTVPVSYNLIAGYHKKPEFCRMGFLRYHEMVNYKERMVAEYDIRLASRDPAVGTLSGGNCQKVIVAREFSQDPKVLLASQPSRGVDVGATEFIHNGIMRQRDKGKAILLISSELSEVVGLSDRVIVLYEGEVVGEFKSDIVTFNELGLYMSGAKRQERASEGGVNV